MLLRDLLKMPLRPTYGVATLTHALRTSGIAYLMPRFMVSAVPIIPMARSMLLQILAAWRDETERERESESERLTHC